MKDRRRFLKNIGVGAAWSTPIVQSALLPAHAQSSISLNFRGKIALEDGLGFSVTNADLCIVVTGTQFDARMLVPIGPTLNAFYRSTGSIGAVATSFTQTNGAECFPGLSIQLPGVSLTNANYVITDNLEGNGSIGLGSGCPELSEGLTGCS